MYVGASTPHETIMGAGRRRAQDRAGGTADRQRLREQKRVSLLSEINGFAADTTCDTLMVRKLPTSCVQARATTFVLRHSGRRRDVGQRRRAKLDPRRKLEPRRRVPGGGHGHAHGHGTHGHARAV